MTDATQAYQLQRPAGPVDAKLGGRAVPLILTLFVLFPFTQLVPLPTYNQPYAFLVSVLILVAVPRSLSLLPAVDRLMLLYMACLGAALFFVSMTVQVSFRSAAFVLSYFSPLCITAACYWAMQRNIDGFRRVLTGAIFVWIAVGAVQTAGFPNFLTFLSSHSSELGANIVASGRGTLSLAPEPTHFGFHMILLAAALYILRGPVWVVGLALASAILLAKSASALLALFLGCFFWALLRPVLRAWFFGSLALVFAFSAMIPLIFDESYRITSIILAIFENGFQIFLLDYSINARLSGVFSSFYAFFDRASVPMGIATEDWLAARKMMLARFDWMIDLSQSGPASGVGSVLVQAGLFSLPLIGYFIWKFILVFGRSLEGLLTAAALCVFLGQIYLATPSFALVLAAIIFRERQEGPITPALLPRWLPKKRNRRCQQASPPLGNAQDALHQGASQPPA